MKTMNRQEELWAGEFGDDYHKRWKQLAPRISVWNRILCPAHDGWRDKFVATALEFGCGRGDNLKALKEFGIKTTGIDINLSATFSCEADTAMAGSVLSSKGHMVGTHDLIITCGLLVHIHPDDLWTAYDNIVGASKRYICIMEYYNPVSVEIEYHGMYNMLWKRDFAGDLLDHYPLKLIDYGFEYHRDGVLDDITWFLLEKTE